MYLIIFIESSGFVYGIMGFVEKISVGATILFIQKCMPELPDENQVTIPYFKWILAFGCGGMFIFSLVLIVFLMPLKIGQRYRVHFTTRLCVTFVKFNATIYF